MRKMKKLFLMLALALFCLFGGFSTTLANVTAEGELTYATFVMQYGASVRLEIPKIPRA